ncbi:MAG: LysR substrate-binding domain-containing protein [Rhizobiaceae bacterium]
MNEFQRRFLPSHSVLRSFEAAARHESFTLAAEELNLTQSAISRQVKELEAVVGADLFRRVGRRVLLTKAGQTLAVDLAVDLENIRRTMMRAISAGDMNSTIRVATLPTFASRWLIPRLPNFAELHPNLEINLSTRLIPFDMEVEHFDVAIHFGEKNWPNTDMRLLCSETMIPVSSPAFREHHKISTVSDLANSPLLHMSTRPTAWQEYLQRQSLEDETYLTGKYFDQFSMVIAGAVASLGAALIPRYLIEQEMYTGALEILIDETITTDNSYFVVTPASQKSKNANAFCDWLIEQIGQPTL